jgi:hypothetical protein
VLGAKLATPRDTQLAHALVWGCAVPFLCVNLLPGALPRYSMPALIPACWLMGMTLAAGDIHVPKWWRFAGVPPLEKRMRLVIFMAIATGLALCLYAVAVIPALQGRAKVKPIAAQIDDLVPESEALYAVDPDYQPFLFYIRRRIVYVSRVDDVSLTARYVLIQPDQEKQVLTSERWAPLRARPIFHVTDYRNHTVILMKVSESAEQH